MLSLAPHSSQQVQESVTVSLYSLYHTLHYIQNFSLPAKH